MSTSRLDQLVKGAPPPDKVIPAISTSPVITSPPSSSSSHLQDPLASLPSSPPQIYLNLLILETSLRAQHLELRARRRQYTFFLTILGLWNLYFGYALFLAPREDGSGVGGSVYWVVEVAEKVAFMGGIVTGVLVWGTGQWERGIRWPRRWVGITNRGLRGFNCKIVIVKGPWWKEWLSTLSFVFSNGLFFSDRGSSYRYIDPDLSSETEKGSKSGLPNIHEDDNTPTGHEEDLAPGGDLIKLLLLPKPFSPAFRENWDLYRTEYWERENERRRILRQKLKIQDKNRARQQPSPSLFSRLRFHSLKNTPKDVEKSQHGSHGSHKHLTATTTSDKRLRARSGSHSRTSSRSTTPTPEFDDDPERRGPARRGSTASTSSNSSLRKKRPNTSSSSPSAGAGGSSSGSGGGARVQKLTPASSSLSESSKSAVGAATGHRSPLMRQNSFSSTDGSRPTTPAETDSLRLLRMMGNGFGGSAIGDSPEKR